MDLTKNAVCLARPMAGRRFKKSSTKMRTPEQLRSLLILQILRPSMLIFGLVDRGPGKTAPGKVRRAGFSSQLTAARTGASLQEDFQHSSRVWAESVSASRQAIVTGCTQPSMPPHQRAEGS